MSAVRDVEAMLEKRHAESVKAWADVPEPTNEEAAANRPMVTVTECARAWHRPESFVLSRIENGALPAVWFGEDEPRIRWEHVSEYCCGVPVPDLTHPDVLYARRAQLKYDADYRASHPWEFSVVYFIECRAAGLVKIGKSHDLASRFYALQRMSAVPLRLVALEPGAFELERKLHKRFRKFRQHGEWFECGPAIVRYAHGLRGWHPLPEWPGKVLSSNVRWKGPRDV